MPHAMDPENPASKDLEVESVQYMRCCFRAHGVGPPESDESDDSK